MQNQKIDETRTTINEIEKEFSKDKNVEQQNLK